MTLRKRLARLEGAAPKPEAAPCAVIRSIVQPGANGPELVAMMHRPLRGGDVAHINRNPRETEADFRARFARAVKPC